ncbi:DUF2778 domain-containing protein [Methylobacterium sp. CM6241]
MAEETKRFTRMQKGFALMGVLPMVGLLGGGLIKAGYWLPFPSSSQLDVMVTLPAVPKASGTEDEAAIVTAAPREPPTVEEGAVPPQSQQPNTYAAAIIPSTPGDLPAPSITVPATAPRASRLVPLPVPRPPEFRPNRAQSSAPRVSVRRDLAVASAPKEDTRSFIDKLFGIESPEPPRLAYAALETKPIDNVFRRALNAVPDGSTGGVAIYDIRARVVTLPNGEKLEAHSGLGESMDDPGHVHVRMKGPTPVGTYDISEREKPFHGVRALRLNPLGGPEAVHGRVGLLAHTYMLGASGASNGCVSFKDYDKFLQAYLRGEVQRLVVIAGG